VLRDAMVLPGAGVTYGVPWFSYGFYRIWLIDLGFSTPGDLKTVTFSPCLSCTGILTYILSGTAEAVN
jgi:hypothetical protein